MKIPSKQTLKKYGLSEDDWKDLYNKYDGCCHLCFEKFGEKRIYIDHEHVDNYKNLTQEERKKKVRGLLNYQCNFILLQKSNDNLDKLRKAVAYLEKYEKSKL